jgi:alpha-beta hydrolase superfamily lysophospholipase
MLPNRPKHTSPTDFFLGSRTIDNIIITREMISDEEYNCKLYFTNMRSNSIPSTRGSFLIVHGFGEHSSRYIPFAFELAKKDFDVFLFDFRGFGYSSGIRASTTLKEFFQDLVVVLNNVNKNAPLYVLGHSMGGGILLSFLKLNPRVKITGVILSNPFMDFPRKLKVNFPKRVAMSFMAKEIPVSLYVFI